MYTTSVQQCTLHGWNRRDVFGIGPARRPGSPSPSEVAQGFGLIPVDCAGRGSRCRRWRKKKRRKRVRKHMQQRHDRWWNDFWGTQTNRQAFTQMCDHIWRASVRSEKKCACVRTVRCSLYTRLRTYSHLLQRQRQGTERKHERQAQVQLAIRWRAASSASTARHSSCTRSSSFANCFDAL